MSVGESVHFEILGRKSNKWSVLEIINDRKAATKKAEDIWGKGQYRGIKVVRESFDISNNTFQSLEIFTRGVARKQSKYDEAGKISPCLTPGDLYTPSGRDSIWELMHNTLEMWRITPTELLHSVHHYNQLYNAGTQLQNAVQRTAVSYEDDPDSIQVRMRKIYKVIDAALDIMKGEADNVPSLELGRLKPLIESLGERRNRSFLLMASIVEYLRPAIALEDKLGRVAIFLSGTRPQWVMDILDQLIAELLKHKSLIREVFATTENRGEMLFLLAHWSAGQVERAEESLGVKVTDDVRRISKWIAEDRLPETCRLLNKQLKLELSSSEPLSEQKSLFDDFKILDEFNTALQWLSDTQARFDGLDSELIDRQNRLLNSQSIADYIQEEKGPFKKVHALLDLDSVTVGSMSSRQIANYIMPILTTPENEARLLGLKENPVQRLQDLVVLQKRVLSSSFGEMHIRKISEKLDGVCKTILDTTGLVKKIQKLDISVSARALKLIDMLAQGYFTDGICRVYAEQVIRDFLSKPEFAKSLLKGQPKSRHDYLWSDVHNRMAAAGLVKGREEPAIAERPKSSAESTAKSTAESGEKSGKKSGTKSGEPVENVEKTNEDAQKTTSEATAD